MSQLPSPEELADFVRLVAQKQIRDRERWDELAPRFIGENALELFEGVVALGDRQSIRKSAALYLANWLAKEENRARVTELDDVLSKPVLAGVEALLRGEQDNEVIYKKTFGQDRKTVERLRNKAALAIAQVLVSDDPGRFARRPRTAAQTGTPTGSEAVHRYLTAVTEYCRSLPRWFSQGLDFTEIQQEVLVRPPEADPLIIDLPEPNGDQVGQSAVDLEDEERHRPLPLVSALQQHDAVLLLGKPGSGKSWAVRGRCLNLAEARIADDGGPIPVLVVAARLEEQLASIPRSNSVDLPRILAESMPEELVAEHSLVETVAGLLASGNRIELLVDGYDEVGEEIPHVDRQLAAIIRLTRSKDSRFVLTSRPTSVPKQSVAKLMATMVLQPFSEREQLAFVDTWFADDLEQARRVNRWVTARRLDLLKTPLLIALLCAVTKPGDSPPESEPALLYRVLTRLTSDEDRYDEVEHDGRLVELRVAALEQIAFSYVDEDRINESISGSELKQRNEVTTGWQALSAASHRNSVLDDLASTGLIQRSVRGQDVEVRFLHNEIRDYLIARALRNQDWRPYIRRIWAQPQWEPPIAYVAAVLDEPDELLLALERRFDADPLNTARFVAGRAVVLAGHRLSEERRRRTRDELLIVLGSHDAVDRGRAAELLAAFDDDSTAEMVRNFITPAAPTRLVTAALRSVAGVDANNSVPVLTASAVDARFLASEREAAVEALASVASPEAVQALEQLARDTDVDPGIRAVAAFEALRRLSVEAVAWELFTSADAASRDARWSLAERVGGQRQSVSDFVAGLGTDAADVPDPYCRALLATETTGTNEVAKFALAPAIPPNPALDLLAQSVELVRVRTKSDPLWETPGRYVMNEREPRSLRWLVARKVLEVSDEKLPALDFWNLLLQDVEPSARIALVGFLLREIDDLPPRSSKKLRAAMESGQLGALALEETKRSRDVAPPALSEPPEQPLPVDDSNDEELPELAEILADSFSGWTVHYQLLRMLRRALPPGGPVFRSAASLTHAITTVEATRWIDAQPLLANALEERLLQSQHEWAHHELVRLRATWPTRQEEVSTSAVSYHSSVLESRAWAALLEDDAVEAASMALAAIGAETASVTIPSEFTARILFASGMLTGRVRDTYDQTKELLSTFDERRLSASLLGCWHQAVTRPPADIGEHAKSLTPRSFESEAESVALRCLAGAADVTEFRYVKSWSACLTASRLLQAIANARRDGAVRDNALAANVAAIEQAARLALTWPPPATPPHEQGRPRWQRQLVDIAVELLNSGMAAGAAVVFRAALRERPNSAELINNLGFCLVPVQRDEALEHLDLAATLYPRPFAVNVANRMVLRFHHSDPQAHSEALAIADSYRIHATTRSEISNGFLWDIDTLSKLTQVPDLDQYISDLAQRLALDTGETDVVRVWQRWDAERIAALGVDPSTKSEGEGETNV